jgi:hypothetical protein
MRMRALVLVAMLSVAVPWASAGETETDGDDEPTITDTFELDHADARSLAARMGGDVFVDHLTQLAHQAAAARAPHLLGALLGPMVQATGDGLTPFLPDGLAAPPAAMPGRNALLVRGTPDAIDEFRELLELLDQPVPLVRIELDAVSSTERFDRDRVLKWRGLSGSMSGTLDDGAAPVGAMRLYVGMGDMGLAVARSERATRTLGSERLMVTTESGSPATITMGTVQPTLLPVTVRDAFGFPATGYEVILTDIMTGLFVLPRVNGNGTVTMHLSPLFQRPAGEVLAPGGARIPIVESLAETTVVTVGDGQTVAIGGLSSVGDTTSRALSPALPEEAALSLARTVERYEVTLFVTPHILPPPRAAGDDVDPFL